MKKSLILFFTIFLILISNFSVMATPGELEPVPEVSAQNVVMINTDTGAEVYSKAADERIYPASLTKLVTMLVVTDLVKDYDQTITATRACYDDLVIGSSNINIQDGEIFTINELMYAVAISSANEATNALAIHLCGGISEFVDKMNEKVKSLGANDTHFINTHGLHDEQHYTTAYDMSIIAKAALENENVFKYISTSVYEIQPTNKSQNKRTLVTTNSLMRQNSGIYYKYCKAGKTGTTTAAGYNLVSMAEKNGTTFLLVAMNSPKKTGVANPIFDDSKTLYNWGFNNYKNSKILKDSEMITEVEVKLSAKGDHLILVPQSSLYSVVPKNLDITTLERKIETNEEILAPIVQGDILGKMTLVKDGIVYGTVNLVASDDIERSTVLYYLHLIQIFFENIWVRIICFILIAFVVIYIVVMISQNNRRRKKKLRRRIRF